MKQDRICNPVKAGALQALVFRYHARHSQLLPPHTQGLVRVDGYVSKESGDLIISDVDTSPALTPDSPLFQQVGSGQREGGGSTCCFCF
jgi:hypothetical protein